MNIPKDNRAISALFRVFGGEEERVAADAEERAMCRGMHLGEWLVLSVLVPLTVIVAVGDWLATALGMTVGWLLVAPVAFLTLQILPFILGWKSPTGQWRLWLACCVIWAVFRREAGGLVGILAYVWIGVAMMNSAAAWVLGWRFSRGVRLVLFIGIHGVAIVIGFKWGWLWTLAAGAGIAACFCWAVLNPYSQWLGAVRCVTDDGEILITIDDGPDPHDTPILLDLLDHYQTKAVFFMIGEKVRSYPELAREVVKRGHEIGNHTMTHPQASFWCAGPWRTYREIAGCQQIIREVAGIKPRWFRAPVGHRNLFTHPVATALGLRVMAWNRRGFDAVEKDPAKVLARILPGMVAGDIILLHEATPIAATVLSGVLEQVGSSN
ncbi:MAG TPA: polysaccharide deacetylase family protein [Luteolibacter sp.]